MTYVDEVRSTIDKQLEGLREERQHLEAARAALKNGAPNGSSDYGEMARQARQQITQGTQRTIPKRRPGRPKGSGTRYNEAVEIVSREPGLPIGEIAKRMRIKQNYLYRVMPNLEREGKVVRDDTGGWFPA